MMSGCGRRNRDTKGMSSWVMRHSAKPHLGHVPRVSRSTESTRRPASSYTCDDLSLAVLESVFVSGEDVRRCWMGAGDPGESNFRMTARLLLPLSSPLQYESTDAVRDPLKQISARPLDPSITSLEDFLSQHDRAAKSDNPSRIPQARRSWQPQDGSTDSHKAESSGGRGHWPRERSNPYRNCRTRAPDFPLHLTSGHTPHAGPDVAPERGLGLAFARPRYVRMTGEHDCEAMRRAMLHARRVPYISDLGERLGKSNKPSGFPGSQESRSRLVADRSGQPRQGIDIFGRPLLATHPPRRLSHVLWDRWESPREVDAFWIFG
jgi:hypothetical protein